MVVVFGYVGCEFMCVGEVVVVDEDDVVWCVYVEWLYFFFV